MGTRAVLRETASGGWRTSAVVAILRRGFMTIHPAAGMGSPTIIE